MNDRSSFEQNIDFLDRTVKRLEDNQVGIDELETLAPEFAKARRACLDRLTRIEAVLQETLQPEQAKTP